MPAGKSSGPSPPARPNIYSTDDQLLYLARELDDRTSGNSEILMDWGNYSVKCTDDKLKGHLVDMARDYLRLKTAEVERKRLDALIGAGI